MTLCKYKAILGNPGVGFHSYRLFNLPIVDVALTVLLAYLLALWKQWAFWKTFVGLFVLGEILHYIFCVDTAVIAAIKGLFHFLKNNI
jgi:hypothetical protein